MKILLISSQYLPTLGGVQTVVHTLAQQFQDRGHTVQVIANRYPRTLPANETLDGVQVRRFLFLYPQLYYLSIGRPDLFAGGLVYGTLTWLKLERLYTRFRPEVINLHHPDHPNLFVLWLRKRHPVRLVVSLHGDEVMKYGERPRCQRGLLRALLQQADAVTACSEYLLGEALGIDPDVAAKGRVLPNGVDLERFEIVDDVLPRPRPYVFAAGRLSYQKGFDILIKAFGLIAHDYPELDLIIAGDGEQKQHLRALIDQLGLRHRVDLIERVSPKQMAVLLKICNAAVIPSRGESFGIVALEALAAGAPVIASRVGGLPELLSGVSDALLVAPDNVDALARGVSVMLSRAHLHPRSKAVEQRRREVVALYNWPRITDGYLRAFGSVDQ